MEAFAKEPELAKTKVDARVKKVRWFFSYGCNCKFAVFWVLYYGITCKRVLFPTTDLYFS